MLTATYLPDLDGIERIEGDASMNHAWWLALSWLTSPALYDNAFEERVIRLYTPLTRNHAAR